VTYHLLPASESALRLLAFDLDGTLVDSAPAIVETVNQVLRENQLAPAPYAAVATLIGLPLETFWRTFTPLPPGAWDALTDRYRTIYRETAIPATVLFAEVRAVIEALLGAGYTLTIASSKITPVSSAVLAQVELLHPFALLMGNDRVTRPKPHAEMLTSTLAHFGLAASVALMIGDTTHDIDLGNNAGVRTAVVTTGTHDHATLLAAAPTAIMASLGELPALLARFALR